MKFTSTLKSIIGSLALFGALQAQAADLTITAVKTQLVKNETTTVTFTFTTSGVNSAVTGFDVTDIKLDNGGLITGFAGSGAVYTATYTKTDLAHSAIRVNSGAFSPSGAVVPLGFNVGAYYLKSGTGPNFTYTAAVPQPSCGLPGQELFNPTTATTEQYYIISKLTEKNVNFFKAIKQGCLVRLQAGQKWVAKTTPTAMEAANVHGGHNHTTNMPKIKLDNLPRVVGVNKHYVRPQNHPCDRSISSGACGDGGDFRSVFEPSHFSNDDPIVFPGQAGAAHAHTFFGNTTIDYATTNANIKPRARSNAAGGKANTSAYWSPSMVDVATSRVLIPKQILVYYKANAFGTDFGQMEPIPPNLKLIAGTPGSTTIQGTGILRFVCFGYDNSESAFGGEIGECKFPQQKMLRMQIDFPPCIADNGSGGMVLDSANHKSHAAYAQNPVNVTHTNGSPLLSNWCPTSHPHRIPGVAQIIDYEIKKGDNTRTWRLSSDNYSFDIPGGRSGHADYWFAWDTPFMDKIVNNCDNMPIDCSVNFIGLNTGIGIQSITTSGNVATVTTTIPHRLPVVGGALPYPAFFSGNKLRVRIQGVTGAEAIQYNFDPTSNRVAKTKNGTNYILPVGSQEITILNATQFTYVLNGTPSNTTVDVSGALVRWGEELCRIGEFCPIAYSDFYYGGS